MHKTMSPQREEAMRVLLDHAGFSGAMLQPLASDASFRRYLRIRMADGRRAMLMDAPPDKEDTRPYIALATHFTGHHYSFPHILAQDEANGFVLLEDFGDDSYSRLLRMAADRAVALEEELYGAAIDVLADWYLRGKAQAEFTQCDVPLYDKALLMREVKLFSDWYLPQVVSRDQAAPLAHEFVALWDALLDVVSLETCAWVHRDYHADNLMWLADRTSVQRVGILDFQDAVLGDPAYDMVSLLEDARRDVRPELAEAMIHRYLEKTGIDPVSFRTAYAVLGAQRNCKIVGIFTRLAARDGKKNYLGFLPRVWRHLATDVTHPELSALADWLAQHIPAQARREIAIRFDAKALGLVA